MQTKQILSLIALFVALALWGTVGVRPAEAATFQVAAPCGATEFIAAYNAARTSGNPSDTVSFTANCTFPVNITLAAALPNMDQAKTLIIDGTNGVDNYARVTINGGGGASDFRFLALITSGGAIEINGLILQDFRRNNSSGSVLRVNAGTTLTIRNSSIVNNTGVGSTAGAVYATGAGATVTIRESFLGGNNSAASGGAVRYDTASGSIHNTTFIGNNTGNNGGAIAINDGTVTLNNVTTHNNTASTAGTAIRVASTATANVNNSIFSGAGSCSIQAGGTFNVTNSYASAAGCTGFTQNANVSDFAALTPAAPTAGTHPPALPLLSTNSAVNTGSATCEATDQRGFSRAGQNCDAGAVESFTPTAVTLSDLQLGQSAVPVALAVGMFLLLGLATAVRLAPTRRR